MLGNLLDCLVGIAKRFNYNPSDQSSYVEKDVFVSVVVIFDICLGDVAETLAYWID